MLASAGVFRLARTGCWSTDALLLASRFAWYTDGASSEPAVASSWAPIGADGPWRPSDEATLTASSFSAEAETVPLGLPAPPTPPGAHASAGGPVATVSPCSLVPDTVPEHTRPVVAPHTGPTVTRNRTMSFPSSPKSSTRSSPPPWCTPYATNLTLAPINIEEDPMPPPPPPPKPALCCPSKYQTHPDVNTDGTTDEWAIHQWLRTR
ncbi:atherin-like [Apis laboriosa]|uniref:atherin-like n=1 Tax=Apis laboriosa TaxID=183418 RepID=UPI001CC5D305|nr:atherin-like [Apis laboriosa]